MRLLLAVLALLACAGCSAHAVSTETTNNADVPVQLLFEHEGRAVYRFYDSGRAIYYVVPDGQVHAPAYWVGVAGKGGHEVPSMQTFTLPQAAPGDSGINADGTGWRAIGPSTYRVTVRR